MNAILTATKQFFADDEGAQIVEYALIIAVVSIILVIALSDLDGTGFGTFINRVENCLEGPTCT